MTEEVLQMVKEKMNEDYFEDEDDSKFPESLGKLLSEASLFYHIPYTYLVPDPKIIPDNELRIFHVDTNWIMALLDGICSIGRNATIDYAHDTKFIYKVYKQAVTNNFNIRRELQNKSIYKKEDVDEDKLPEITGFLLNSVCVEYFRGLEFKAYPNEAKTDGETKLIPIRIETIGQNMLLGLFLGEIKRLEIAEPPEGLHFGAEIGKDGDMEKRLRDLKTGELLPESGTMKIEFKGNKDDRIIDIRKIAENLKDKYNSQDLTTNKNVTIKSVTSAEIATQMIQNAHTAIFSVVKEVTEDNG